VNEGSGKDEDEWRLKRKGNPRFGKGKRERFLKNGGERPKTLTGFGGDNFRKDLRLSGCSPEFRWKIARMQKHGLCGRHMKEFSG
jgi:hypothetical protein